ncbi:MAG: ABC transporter substrate-binding protein [Saccharofermentanales bacterium]
MKNLLKSIISLILIIILTIYLTLISASCKTNVPIVKTESIINRVEKHKIKISVYVNDTELVAFQNTLQELNAKSNKYILEIQDIPVNNYFKELDNLINDDRAPDLMMIDSITTYNYMKTGKFLDITKKAEEDIILKLEKYFKGTLDTVKFNGKIYGLPYDCTPTVMFYNIEIFNKEGIPYPSDNWKWEDFRKYAKMLTKDTNGDGVIDQWGMWPKFSMGWLHIIPTYGGDFKDITSNECVKALTMYANIINDKSYSLFESPDKPEENPSFGKGNMAMDYGLINKYIINFLKRKFDFGIIGMPYETKRCVHVTVNDIMINAKTKYPDESYHALVDLTKALLYGNYLPPTKEGFELTAINYISSGYDANSIQKILDSDYIDIKNLDMNFYYGPAWSVVVLPITEGIKTVEQAMKDMKAINENK